MSETNPTIEHLNLRNTIGEKDTWINNIWHLGTQVWDDVIPSDLAETLDDEREQLAELFPEIKEQLKKDLEEENGVEFALHTIMSNGHLGFLVLVGNPVKDEWKGHTVEYQGVQELSLVYGDTLEEVMNKVY